MSYTIEDRNDNTDNIIKTVKVWTSMTIVYTTNKRFIIPLGYLYKVSHFNQEYKCLRGNSSNRQKMNGYFFMLLSTSFMAKYELVFVLTRGNAYL